VGFNGGVNLGLDDELRAGVILGYLRASVGAGAPNLPEVSGRESRFVVRWLHDGQDSPVVPSQGLRANGTFSYLFDSPELTESIPSDRTNNDLKQLEGTASSFWSIRSKRDRFFMVGGVGTSFSGHPLATEQFQLGRPLFLSAYDVGELRGDHYASVTGGYLRGIGRLPDFLGGPIFLGGWLETGSAFDDLDTAKLRGAASVGVIGDTLVGPVLVGASFGSTGNWRYYIGIGRLF
jgi:NTE family protein